MLGEFLTTSLLLVGAAQPQGAGAAAPATSQVHDLALDISASRYGSDNRKTSGAGSSGSNSFSTTIYTTDTCAMGAESVAEGTPPRTTSASVRPHTMWQVSGRIVDRTGFGLAVAIDWRRVTDGGKSIENGPSGSMQVTIRSGERLLLDTVSCPDASTIRLEAAVVARTDRYGSGYYPFPGVAGGRGAGAPSAAGAAGVRGGRGGGGVGTPQGTGRGAATGGAVGTPQGVAAGGGTGSGAGSGTGAGGAGASGIGVGGRGSPGGVGRGGAPGVAGRGRGMPSTAPGQIFGDQLNTRRLNVELWLVHLAPSREEAVQRVTVRTAGATNYGFPAIALPTSDGANVEVNGQVQLLPEAVSVNGQPVPDSARRLSVFIQRRIFTSADPRGIAWSTTKVIDMPAAADVVEFELPPLEGEAYKGHKLSLRLRITQ